ncbi:MAG TPA: thioesterase family protein [Ktedonobacterales bacterium]|nr:thioesterase family protein [Ktedonobacterales bacterium]
MPQVQTRIRVPFPDVDSSGRIHFIALFRYFEVADHDLMRAIGYPYSVLFRDQAYPRVHASCDYRGPIYFDDVLVITARIAHVGTSSWTVAFAAQVAEPSAIMPDDQRDITAVVAEGKITIASMHPQEQRAIPIPNGLRQALSGESLP